MKKTLWVALLCLSVSGGILSEARAASPLAVDSRIRTVIYNENEVFRLTTDYGYQSNIVFSDKEVIRTISIGDAVPFKVTPSGNRIFIKALQKGHITNMTVVTTERVYQFELSSNVQNVRDVVYVMRFFYPQDDIESLYAGEITEQNDVVVQEFSPDVRGTSSVQPAQQPVGGAAQAEEISFSSYVNESLTSDAYNYLYSISGPSGEYDFSPSKIFDDGQVTFLKFKTADANVVSLFEVGEDGLERPVTSSFDGEFLVVQGVLNKVAVRMGSDVICVFNDKK